MLYLRYRTPPSCQFPGWPSVKEFPGIPVPPEEVELALAATKEFASEFNRRHFYPNRTVHYDTKAFMASKELRQRIRSLFLLKMKKEKMKKEKKERKPKEKKIETVKEKKLKTVKEKKEKKVKVSKPKKEPKKDISSLIPSLSFRMTLLSSLFCGTSCRADLKSPKASLDIPRDL